MTDLVLLVLIFLLAGGGVLAANLALGRLVRPHRPNPEKGAVYECGEPTVGSAWVQFDLRFYVVALLFVIFDVELAFFFPWAVVFGSATRAGDASLPAAERAAAYRELHPGGPPGELPDPAAMTQLAWVGFADLMVFFAVLLVGFAYLWRRGDLDWVRSTTGQGAESVSAGVSVSEITPREPAPVLPSHSH